MAWALGNPFRSLGLLLLLEALLRLRLRVTA